jgi:hypothetical protein
MKRLALALCIIGAATCARAELHTFTDTQGRTIQAELLSVKDNQIRVRREDGQVFTLPFDSLVKEDITYIATWRRQHVEVKLHFTASPFHVTAEHRNTEAIQTTTEKAGYSITLFNDAADAASDFKVDYILFYTEGEWGGGQASDLPLKRKSGNIPIALLEGGKSVILKTDPVTLRKSKYNPDWGYDNSKYNKWGDDLAGVWVRVSLNGKVVSEFVSSERIKKAGWKP